MPLALPLSSLLSQVLVAFTIEVDNEFERLMPHRTTWGPAAGSARGPWLVSLVMWSNFMQYVPPEGRTLRELDGPARMTNLAGLQRWGYIDLGPAATDPRPKPPRADLVVRPTPAGRQAQELWGPLPAVVEARWRERLGPLPLDRLRRSLAALSDRIETELPDYLPVVHHELSAEVLPIDRALRPDLEARRGADLDLSVLLSRILLSFTVDVERSSALSLAVAANVLRVLDMDGVRLRNLPRLTGVSKEAVSVSAGLLERRGYLCIAPNPDGIRSKLARLTEKGRSAQAAHAESLALVEQDWTTKYGPTRLNTLRRSLEQVLGAPGAGELFTRGPEPDPAGWRAFAPVPQTLAHHPMVLHRGGFPDGS